MGKRIRRKSNKPQASEQEARHTHTSEPSASEHPAVPHAAGDVDRAPEQGEECAKEASKAEPAVPANNAGFDNEDAPRKRRRTRRRRKNRDVGELSIGPDPATFEGLSDGAQRALTYAQAFTQTREAWKFSKPRQNWLIRHVLWSPAVHSAAVRAAETEVPEQGAWVPDEYVPVVAVYLASVQGSALQRLLEGLQSTENVNEEAPGASETANVSAPDAGTGAEAVGDRSGAAAGVTESGEEPSVTRLRAERASFVLRWINSRLYMD